MFPQTHRSIPLYSILGWMFPLMAMACLLIGAGLVLYLTSNLGSVVCSWEPDRSGGRTSSKNSSATSPSSSILSRLPYHLKPCQQGGAAEIERWAIKLTTIAKLNMNSPEYELQQRVFRQFHCNMNIKMEWKTIQLRVKNTTEHNLGSTRIVS